MPDVYARITELDEAVVEQLADAMELRATDPEQRAFVDAYLSELDLPDRARFLEIGCGTGAISRVLAARGGVGSVVGVDPSQILLDRARELSSSLPNLTFEQGDGRDLPFGDERFDAVVLHTVLSHVPDPDAVMREANRVLVSGGALVVFDGDYATLTLGIGDGDPLEACADEFRGSYINDPWVMRRVVQMMLARGFENPTLRSHGFVQIRDAAYMLSILARGADALVVRRVIAAELAEAPKVEGQRRERAGSFFGHIAYMSVAAKKL